MKKTIQFITWVVVLQLIGYGMGQITDASVDPWYLALTKSGMTPPGYVFGIVWTVLYLMLAAVGWQLWVDSGVEATQKLRALFAAQLVFNWLWTPLFFYLHWVGAALLCLGLIVLLTAKFLVLAYRYRMCLFWLMLPYFLWVCFASYLNAAIYIGI